MFNLFEYCLIYFSTWHKWKISASDVKVYFSSWRPQWGIVTAWGYGADLVQLKCGCWQSYERRMNELTIKTTAIWICIIVWFLYVRGPGSFCFVFWKKTSVMYFSLSFWIIFLDWSKLYMYIKSQSLCHGVLLLLLCFLHILCPCALTPWRVHTVSYCGVIIVNTLIIGWLGFKPAPCPPHRLDIIYYAFLTCHVIQLLCHFTHRWFVPLHPVVCLFIQSSHFVQSFVTQSFICLCDKALSSYRSCHSIICHVLSVTISPEPRVSSRQDFDKTLPLICHCIQAFVNCHLILSISDGISFVISFHPIHWDFITFSPVESIVLFE